MKFFKMFLMFTVLCGAAALFAKDAAACKAGKCTAAVKEAKAPVLAAKIADVKGAELLSNFGDDVFQWYQGKNQKLYVVYNW